MGWLVERGFSEPTIDTINRVFGAIRGGAIVLFLVFLLKELLLSPDRKWANRAVGAVAVLWGVASVLAACVLTADVCCFLRPSRDDRLQIALQCALLRWVCEVVLVSAFLCAAGLLVRVVLAYRREISGKGSVPEGVSP